MTNIAQALFNNCGQVLTTELINGILYTVSNPPPTPIDPRQFQPVEKGGYVYAAEPADQILGELAPMAEAMTQELFGVRYADEAGEIVRKYNAGRLVVFTARNSGTLVGFMAFDVYTTRITKELIADDDGLYIHPDYRNHVSLATFFNFIKRSLAQLGCVRLEIKADAGGRIPRLAQWTGLTQDRVIMSTSLEEYR
jgi:GNAT superfamily N-acetyltransferase